MCITTEVIVRRIVLVGSKDWRDRSAMESGLVKAAQLYPQSEKVRLVHGGDDAGACFFAEMIWHDWVSRHPYLFAESELHPLARFNSEFLRDQHMITQDVDVVVTFFTDTVQALSSYGTPSTAWKTAPNQARKRDIPVFDFGVSSE